MNSWLAGSLLAALAVLAVLLYRERRNRLRAREAFRILDDIIAGNGNRRIHVGAGEPLAPLIYKINLLVDSFRKEKTAALRNEQARKRLLSNLSHDVRTPLTSLIGYLDALSEGLAEDEAAEYLQIARGKANALKSYIDELFLVARMDADELRLTLGELDGYEWLRRELIGFAPELQRAGIALEADIPDGEAYLLADGNALARVFHNLFRNALRYGAEGSVVGVSAWTDGGGFYFEVWDKGPGLSPEEIGRAFERLYRGDSSRSSRGHGLGLAIAKELVTRLQGTIVMSSVPHVKTAVRVGLPLVKKK